MESEAEQQAPRHLTESITIPSDSESYSANNELSSSSPPSSSSSPLILYSPPTIWSLLRGAAINLLLPFVNGLMLGLGELLAHEAAFRLGWGGTKVGLNLLLPGLENAVAFISLEHSCMVDVCIQGAMELPTSKVLLV